MSCRRSRLPWCALLALCILGVSAQAQPPANVVAAVAKLTADVAAGKKIDAKGFAAKWNDLEDVMPAAFKPVRNQPSLEAVLNKLSKKSSFTAADKAMLTKIADLSRAMAIVTPHYDYKTKGNAAKKKDWDKWNKDMEAGSNSLLMAIKAGGAPTIAKEATKLAGSCSDCHSKFK